MIRQSSEVLESSEGSTGLDIQDGIFTRSLARSSARPLSGMSTSSLSVIGLSHSMMTRFQRQEVETATSSKSGSRNWQIAFPLYSVVLFKL